MWMKQLPGRNFCPDMSGCGLQPGLCKQEWAQESNGELHFRFSKNRN